MATANENLKLCGIPVQSNIGSGTFAKVYAVDDKTALKVYGLNESRLYDINDIDVLSRFVHPYITHANKILFDQCDKTIGLLMKRAKGDLDDIVNKEKISQLEIIKLMYDVGTALSFMHQNNVLHLDIKPKNILYFLDEKDSHVALTDFGASLQIVNSNSIINIPNNVGTYEFLPPENLPGERENINVSVKTDVWSYGMTFLALITNSEVDNPDIIEKHLQWIIERRITDSKLRPTILDFFEKIFIKDPNNRPVMDEILKHSIFKGFLPVKTGSVITPTINNKHLTSEKKTILISYIKTVIKKMRILQAYEDDQISIACVFLAIDLLYRCIELIEEYGKRLHVICMNIAILYYCSQFTVDIENLISTDDYPMDEDDIIPYQRDVLKYLKGIIYRDYLFASINNINELKDAINNTIYDTEKYLALNPKKAVLSDNKFLESMSLTKLSNRAMEVIPILITGIYDNDKLLGYKYSNLTILMLVKPVYPKQSLIAKYLNNLLNVDKLFINGPAPLKITNKLPVIEKDSKSNIKINISDIFNSKYYNVFDKDKCVCFGYFLNNTIQSYHEIDEEFYVTKSIYFNLNGYVSMICDEDVITLYPNKKVIYRLEKHLSFDTSSIEYKIGNDPVISYSFFIKEKGNQIAFITYYTGIYRKPLRKNSTCDDLFILVGKDQIENDRRIKYFFYYCMMLNGFRRIFKRTDDEYHIEDIFDYVLNYT